mgnify:CR=1 FL=1
MVRMQIQLTEAQSEALRDVATERGVSISAVVREAVEEAVLRSRHKPPREELLRRSLAAAGRFSSGGEAARRHDEYFGAEH